MLLLYNINFITLNLLSLKTKKIIKILAFLNDEVNSLVVWFSDMVFGSSQMANPGYKYSHYIKGF